MKTSFLKATTAVAGIILAGNAGVRGDTLYQNTANPAGQVMNLNNNQQVGEQIWLGPTVPEYLTNFSFQYYSPVSVYSGNVQMDVRLYANDGTPFNGYATPSSILFDSGNFALPTTWSVAGTNSATVVFQLSDLLSGTIPLDQNLSLPTNFTFSVTVSGLSGSDEVGLPIFGQTPQVGWNAGDYWYDVSGNWQLLTNSAGPIAFGSQFLGQTTPTPEPTVLCLGALGAAALMVIARRRQRRE
jgi:MYXO-CTERM domain-containing protein